MRLTNKIPLEFQMEEEPSKDEKAIVLHVDGKEKHADMSISISGEEQVTSQKQSHGLRFELPKTAIVDIDVNYTNEDGNIIKYTKSVNLLHHLVEHPLRPEDFQKQQEELPHTEVLFMTPSTISVHQILVEILRSFKAAVVLDRITPTSRTCWFSSTISTSKVLVVVDAVVSGHTTHVTIDVWSDLKNAKEAMLDILSNTELGEINSNLDRITCSWTIERESNQHMIIIELASDTEAVDHDIFLTIEYRGMLSENYQLSLHGDREEISISFDDELLKPISTLNPDDTFLALYISDASWKSLENARKISYCWREACKRQILKKLHDRRRFTELGELALQLGLSPTSETNIILRDFLIDLCEEMDLTGCNNQRASDHCMRAVILSAMVICINPPRGLTGYLQMLFQKPTDRILKLGSERTWRDHLTQIVGSSTAFKPQTVKVKGRKKNRGRGRPPIHLIPTIPAVDLFNNFLTDPASIVCKYCRFSEE